MSIEDSGTGISQADRARIFDPLFTTKAGGMGMGLSICHSIIENHGGKIWVEPAAGRGSIFQFELPAAESRDERRDLAGAPRALRPLADALAFDLQPRLHRLPGHGHPRAHLGGVVLRRIEGKRA